MQKEQEKKFDTLVTIRDGITGQVIDHNPYTLRILGKEGSNERVRIWERPVKSGNLFNSKNEPIGRWVDGNWDKKAEHIAFVKPETKDQMLAREVVSKDAKIAELELELAAIKAESDKKAPVQKKA